MKGDAASILGRRRKKKAGGSQAGSCARERKGSSWVAAAKEGFSRRWVPYPGVVSWAWGKEGEGQWGGAEGTEVVGDIIQEAGLKNWGDIERRSQSLSVPPPKKKKIGKFPGFLLPPVPARPPLGCPDPLPPPRSLPIGCAPNSLLALLEAR